MPSVSHSARGHNSSNKIPQFLVSNFGQKFGYSDEGFSGTFAKLRKAPTSSVMSVRMEKISSYRTDFHDILHLGILRKSVENAHDSLKSDKNNGHFT
jgi:hypothetical protein